MKISREARRTARELFQLCLVRGRLDAARVSEVSSHLVAARPRNYVQTLKEFTRLVRLQLERRHAIVESAVALDSATADGIAAQLKTNFGEDITIEFRVTPGLIGGLRVKLGSDVWDGSVRARLSAIARQL